MSFKLDNAKVAVRYSKHELAVARLLPMDPDMIDSQELIRKFYKARGEPIPFHADLTWVVRSLMKKMNYNKEKFVIIKSEQRGPHSMDYRLKKRA